MRKKQRITHEVAVEGYYKAQDHTINKPESVDARHDTTAEEILSKCNNDILKPMFTMTNSSGSKGAPSHPVIKSCLSIMIQI